MKKKREPDASLLLQVDFKRALAAEGRQGIGNSGEPQQVGEDTSPLRAYPHAKSTSSPSSFPKSRTSPAKRRNGEIPSKRRKAIPGDLSDGDRSLNGTRTGYLSVSDAERIPTARRFPAVCGETGEPLTPGKTDYASVNQVLKEFAFLREMRSMRVKTSPLPSHPSDNSSLPPTRDSKT